MKSVILWRETEWHLTLPGIHYWGQFHSHGFWDERTLEAQPWRTERLRPWQALTLLAWRPTSNQIKMLQTCNEQGNLCSARCPVQRYSSHCLPSPPCFVIYHLTPPPWLMLAQSQLIRQPRANQGASSITAELHIVWITLHLLFSLPHQPILVLEIFHFLSNNFVSSSDRSLSQCYDTAFLHTLPDLNWLCPNPKLSPFPTFTALKSAPHFSVSSAIRWSSLPNHKQ